MSKLGCLHVLYDCTAWYSCGTSNNGSECCLWLFCLHLGSFSVYWVVKSNHDMRVVQSYCSLVRPSSMDILGRPAHLFPPPPTLKGNRLVDLGKRESRNWEEWREEWSLWVPAQSGLHGEIYLSQPGLHSEPCLKYKTKKKKKVQLLDRIKVSQRYLLHLGRG